MLFNSIQCGRQIELKLPETKVEGILTIGGVVGGWLMGPLQHSESPLSFQRLISVITPSVLLLGLIQVRFLQKLHLCSIQPCLLCDRLTDSPWERNTEQSRQMFALLELMSLWREIGNKNN